MQLKRQQINHVSNLSQGLTIMIFGTTLLDVADHINVGVSIVSLMFFVRAVGSIIGTVGAGFLLDHFPRLQNTLLCLFTLGMVVGIHLYYHSHAQSVLILASMHSVN